MQQLEVSKFGGRPQIRIIRKIEGVHYNHDITNFLVSYCKRLTSLGQLLVKIRSMLLRVNNISQNLFTWTIYRIKNLK